jgi:hypothetical protein
VCDFGGSTELVRLVGVSISLEKNFYRLPFTPPLSGRLIGPLEPIKILLEGDGNSNKMNTASNTLLQLTTQVGQAHVATGVPVDLGTNTQPSDPRTQRNTKPRVYRPTPVRPVSTTGQTGPY